VKRFLIPLTLAAAALTVFAYNYQGYCRGRCTLRGFGLFGPFELSMLLLLPLLLLFIEVAPVPATRRFPLLLRRAACRKLALLPRLRRSPPPLIRPASSPPSSHPLK
jgi:hypothetical protein